MTRSKAVEPKVDGPTEAERLAAQHNDPNRSKVVPPEAAEPPAGPPVITAVVPDSATIGDPSFDLVIEGTGFTAASVIWFAGHDEPTTLAADGLSVSTGVDMSVWHGPDVLSVTVANGEAHSNALGFTFYEAESGGFDAADPDEMEDEIEQAIDDGDVQPKKPKRRR